jgi:hypothetical protein
MLLCKRVSPGEEVGKRQDSMGVCKRGQRVFHGAPSKNPEIGKKKLKVKNFDPNLVSKVLY